MKHRLRLILGLPWHYYRTRIGFFLMAFGLRLHVTLTRHDRAAPAQNGEQP